jgi:hypothetical protein
MGIGKGPVLSFKYALGGNSVSSSFTLDWFATQLIPLKYAGSE